MELTSNYQEMNGLMAMLASFLTWNLNCHKVARLPIQSGEVHQEADRRLLLNLCVCTRLHGVISYV